MANITKDSFVRSLAEAEGITIKEAGIRVNSVLNQITELVPTLKDGEKLNFNGVVQFEVSDVPEREVRNPQNGETITKEATRKVKARPMSVLKSAVIGG